MSSSVTDFLTNTEDREKENKNKQTTEVDTNNRAPYCTEMDIDFSKFVNLTS